MLGVITTSDLSQFWLFLVRKLAPANCLKMLWKWATNVDCSTIFRKITESYQKVTTSNKRLQQDCKHRIYAHYVSAVRHSITTTPSPLPHTIKYIIPSYTTLYTIPPYQYNTSIYNIIYNYILYILSNNDLNI